MTNLSLLQGNVRLQNAGRAAAAGEHVLLKAAGAMILLAISAIPAYYAGGFYGYLPGLTLLVFYGVSALHLMILWKGIHFETEATDLVCEKGELASAALKIRNDSRLPCIKLSAELYIGGFFPGEGTVEAKTLGLEGKSDASFVISSKMNHIGVYEAGIKNLSIYDLTGMFCIKIKGGATFEITVLPKVTGGNVVRLDERRLTESQNVQKKAVSDGFDYTGVREYALGDSMKRIHWKLSAHSSDYMTKITESSRKSDLAVILDLVSISGEPKMLPWMYDSLVEAALSLIEQAAAREIEYALFFVGRDKELHRVCPRGQQDYPDLIRILPPLIGTRSRAAMDGLDGAAILDKEKQLSNRSTNLILCTSHVTDMLIWELISAKKQQRNPELYYILPPGTGGETDGALDHRARRKEQSNLTILEEYGIRCHWITSENEKTVTHEVRQSI
ncbi:DUF58 domain-containing protein [Anoxybacterium hadale]|uniref:DUF58 domain-containing protein n=1 Tax=Anoxybacterium hadale TaxID=3408580 RepID=A0ACD1AEB9_9FIRM|nr:DUF58 domain-containing protein [Clostridiales bacterium]